MEFGLALTLALARCERRLILDSLDGSDRTQALVSKGVGRSEQDGAVCQRTRQPLSESPIACTDLEHTQRRGERARRGGGFTWVVRSVLVRGRQYGVHAATRWAATAAGCRTYGYRRLQGSPRSHAARPATSSAVITSYRGQPPGSSPRTKRSQREQRSQEQRASPLSTSIG